LAKITVREIISAKPQAKPFKLTVDRGLHIRVATNGEKRWIVKYSIDGKQKEVRLPAPFGIDGDGYMSLVDAIAENAKVQSLARKNIDYFQNEKDFAVKQKELDKANQERNLSFNDLFNLWIKDGVNRSDNNAYINGSFRRHALPYLANVKIKDLTEADLLMVLRRLVSAEKYTTALELYKDIKQMLSWGEKRKPWRALMIDGSPAELINIKNVLPRDFTKERDRVLSNDELKNLKQIFDTPLKLEDNASLRTQQKKPIQTETQIAVWICLSSLCRIGELMKAKWENVNFSERVWFIPASDTKGESGKRFPQYVYMSDFTYELFNKMHKISGNTEWVFPSRNKDKHICEKSFSKQIGDRQIIFKNRTKKLKNRSENNLLVIGKTEWTIHDLRRTGATIMQKLKIPRDIINLCQNHTIGSKVDRHYLHHDYFNEKKDAWCALGDYLVEQINPLIQFN
jgi:integrase